MTGMTTPDLTALVDRYRETIAKLESATDGPGRAEFERIAARLRQQWVEHNGGDVQELHEVAFGDDLGK